MVWGMNASNMHTSNLTNTQRWTLYLNWTDEKVKTEYMVVKIVSMFRTAVQFFYFGCQRLFMRGFRIRSSLKK